MLLRRRCGTPDLLAYFAITAITAIVFLVCTIVYGTRTERPEIPTIVKELLPAGRCLCESSTTFTCDSCLTCAVTHSIGNIAEVNDSKHWTFNYARDGPNYGLDEKQCQSAFPGLFEDINRAVKVRKDKHITERELSSFALSKGMVRAMIYNRELYIIQTEFVDSINRRKGVSVLSSLHRAIVSAPHKASIPNIEFVFSVEDLPACPEKPIWVHARRAQDADLWLMPDFAFWAWDMPQVGAFSEVAAEAIQREVIERWDMKQEKLVWRGKVTMAPKLRRALMDAAKGKPWSDVGAVHWGRPGFEKQFLGPVDQCGYKFIAHAEGRSYSGALKYRQLCRSVIVSHKLQWIQHHHYLLKASGSNQNYVEVERDFHDLEEIMQDLLKHPEKAKRIANKNVETFRERYLTPAAEVCYWRALIRAWKTVSFEPLLHQGVEIGGKQSRARKRGVRFETFV